MALFHVESVRQSRFIQTCRSEIGTNLLKKSALTHTDVRKSVVAILFVLHLVFVAFQVRDSTLQTHASLPAAVLNFVATFAASSVSLSRRPAFLETIRSSCILTFRFPVFAVYLDCVPFGCFQQHQSVFVDISGFRFPS